VDNPLPHSYYFSIKSGEMVQILNGQLLNDGLIASDRAMVGVPALNVLRRVQDDNGVSSMVALAERDIGSNLPASMGRRGK
jgi:hypothetical protein